MGISELDRISEEEVEKLLWSSISESLQRIGENMDRTLEILQRVDRKLT